MLERLDFETTIHLEDIPIQWVSKIELYYPDLPGFPIVYVNLNSEDGKRIYGFAASISYRFVDEKYCNADLLFVSNVDLDSAYTIKNAVVSELKERFGINRKFCKKEVIEACKGNPQYEEFFTALWEHVSKVIGDSVPYGRFYEEIYSIVRFVSAWQPKTGRQSEMRMLYNFLSYFGEKIVVSGKWKFVEFYLLPSYDDLLKKDFVEFPRFYTLFTAMEKVWKEYFTMSIDLNDIEIKFMKKAWPQNKDEFISEVSRPLLDKKVINSDEQFSIEGLVDAFNRHPWRAAFFVWSIMTIWSKDYRKWEKKNFTNLVLSKKTGVGISEKVVGCFLQQGFGKEEIIPVDTWVQSFYEGALGIEDKAAFFNDFDKMGKLERLIWLSSQGRKTNIGGFYDILWCIRYGVTGNSELRGSNPISCYECKLKEICPGYIKIRNQNVFVKD